MRTLKKLIKDELTDYKILLRNIPSLTISFFILSVVCANLMANKELFSYKYVALDCGFVFSWIMFLCMDVICKRWGPKASVKVSMLALVVNLAVCGSFWLLSKAPGMWGAFYDYLSQSGASASGVDVVSGAEAAGATPFTAIAVNAALNSTVGGSWYVVLGSGLAFLTSSFVNAVVNKSVGAMMKKDNFAAFAVRSYTSTIIAQFVDNFVFALVVSKIFFGWTWTQVIFCSIIGAVCELLCEVLFSGFGYKVVCQWEKENVGKEYFEYLEKRK